MALCRFEWVAEGSRVRNIKALAKEKQEQQGMLERRS
jgi:hypothetical protein